MTRSPRIHLVALLAAGLTGPGARASDPPAVSHGYKVPLVDLAGPDEAGRRAVVDREPGQYLGHPTTVLLEDGRTILAVYPKGHGRGPIVLKRSDDGGRTWSDRLPTPENWATSRETPTIHRVVDPDGRRRLVLFSGLHPIRMASSEDDGRTWTPLEPIGDFGGIVAMSSVERLADGSYMALFHDDGRYLRGGGEPGPFRVYKTVSRDGGRTWGPPSVIAEHPAAHLCEPGLVRSPDGRQIAVLLRENSRKFNSFLIVSDDEGETWSEPRELPGALTGDRHVGKYGPDGRLFLSFRDTTRESPTKGDWVGWVGTYDDVIEGREGQYRVRLLDNTKAADCAYPGVEVLPDGTFVTTTYGHWDEGEPPYVVSVRFRLDELDALAGAGRAGEVLEVSDRDGLLRALDGAGPGTTIRLAPGTYRGGISARGLRGEPGRPVVLEAADPARPPLIEGGGTGLHLSAPAHVELRRLAFAGASGNGLNIDDGGQGGPPAVGVVLRELAVRDVGPSGNRDGIKLSGVADFRVEGCTVERWGSSGSGIDMVGCRDGTIVGCLFRHGDSTGSNAVQAKGGSRSIAVRACRFEHAGLRALNLGGSTGMEFFRPRPEGFEARDITVEDCTIIGSEAAVAFVGVDGAVVRRNTIVRPRRFAIRILQETTGPDFVPCRDGQFLDNLVAFRSGEMRQAVNVGAGTAPETFTFAGNAWTCLDEPGRSRPELPTPEADGRYGIDPEFLDPDRGDYRPRPGSPLAGLGARVPSP